MEIKEIVDEYDLDLLEAYYSTVYGQMIGMEFENDNNPLVRDFIGDRIKALRQGIIDKDPESEKRIKDNEERITMFLNGLDLENNAETMITEMRDIYKKNDTLNVLDPDFKIDKE